MSGDALGDLVHAYSVLGGKVGRLGGQEAEDLRVAGMNSKTPIDKYCSGLAGESACPT